jgi:hypothetical protein
MTNSLSTDGYSNPRHILEPKLLHHDPFLTLFEERQSDLSDSTRDWNEYFKLAFLEHRNCVRILPFSYSYSCV